jgi:hypothetical protein
MLDYGNRRPLSPFSCSGHMKLNGMRKGAIVITRPVNDRALQSCVPSTVGLQSGNASLETSVSQRVIFSGDEDRCTS